MENKKKILTSAGSDSDDFPHYLDDDDDDGSSGDLNFCTLSITRTSENDRTLFYGVENHSSRNMIDCAKQPNSNSEQKQQQQQQQSADDDHNVATDIKQHTEERNGDCDGTFEEDIASTSEKEQRHGASPSTKPASKDFPPIYGQKGTDTLFGTASEIVDLRTHRADELDISAHTSTQASSLPHKSSSASRLLRATNRLRPSIQDGEGTNEETGGNTSHRNEDTYKDNIRSFSTSSRTLSYRQRREIRERQLQGEQEERDFFWMMKTSN